MSDEALKQEIFQRVSEITSDVLQIEPDVEITLETSIKKDLAADSVDLVSLVMDLEDEFGATIPEEDVIKLETIGDIVSYIAQKAAEQE
jgi:acyl carrier protein